MIYAVGNKTDAEVKEVIREIYWEARMNNDSFLADQIALVYAGLPPNRWSDIIDKISADEKVVKP